MAPDNIDITGETTLETILEDVPAARDTLLRYFGPSVVMPGQTWTSEPLSHACVIRGVDESALLADLRKLLKKHA